jgi:hypothetical protein
MDSEATEPMRSTGSDGAGLASDINEGPPAAPSHDQDVHNPAGDEVQAIDAGPPQLDDMPGSPSTAADVMASASDDGQAVAASTTDDAIDAGPAPAGPPNP